MSNSDQSNPNQREKLKKKNRLSNQKSHQVINHVSNQQDVNQILKEEKNNSNSWNKIQKGWKKKTKCWKQIRHLLDQ